MSPEAIAQELTSLYRTPQGTMTLRPDQGMMILAASTGGLWSNVSVGGGKSLGIALILAAIGGERPLVLTESSNIPQLRKAFEEYRVHWQIPSAYRIAAYETLSSPRHRDMLDSMRPTLVALDEGHKLKAVTTSARAKRFDRWRDEHPDVPVCNVSGSPGRDLSVIAPGLLWAVPAASAARGGRIPVDADGKPRGAAFKEFCKQLNSDQGLHDAFWEWLRRLDGVYVSAATFTDIPLTLRHEVLETPDCMRPHWQALRDFGEAPDGWTLEGPAEQWILARCMANGMYYEHDPRPPRPYLDARKEWYGYVREIIDWGDGAPGGPYDTEGTVKAGIDAGLLRTGATVLRKWREIAPTYAPVTTTTWLSDHALNAAWRWGEDVKERAIIWVGQTGVGLELSRRTGWPYYGDDACDARGRHVSWAKAPVIICSRNSCGTGKDLQHRYSSNYFMGPPSNNDACEQNLGRTHRPGQPRPRVDFTFAYGCLEDWCAFEKSMAEARQAEIDLTAPRKLLLAEHARTRFPEEGGPAWQRGGAVVVEVGE